MMRWLLFVMVLTLGTVFYQYPSLYNNVKERTPAWLGMKTDNKLYRWQDESGNWQVSDKTPGKGIAYETLNIRHDRQSVQLTENNLPTNTQQSNQ